MYRKRNESVIEKCKELHWILMKYVDEKGNIPDFKLKNLVLEKAENWLSFQTLLPDIKSVENGKIVYTNDFLRARLSNINLKIEPLISQFVDADTGILRYTYKTTIEEGQNFGHSPHIDGQIPKDTCLGDKNLYLAKDLTELCYISKDDYLAVIKETQNYRIQKKILFFQNVVFNGCNLNSSINL